LRTRLAPQSPVPTTAMRMSCATLASCLRF
jgi:hypothetical protein